MHPSTFLILHAADGLAVAQVVALAAAIRLVWISARDFAARRRALSRLAALNLKGQRS